MHIPIAVKIFILIMSGVMSAYYPNLAIWFTALFVATIISIFENIII